MKIGLVTACYKPVVNGVTRMVESLALGLIDLGHQPTVITLGPATAEDRREPFPVVRSPGVKLGRSGYFGAFRYTKETGRIVREMDVLHAHHPAMCIELVAPIRAGIPLLFTNHTRYDRYAPLYLPLPKQLSKPIAHQLTRTLWPKRANLADHLIAPTHRVREIMRQFNIVKPISVIPNGIPPLPPTPPWPRSSVGWTANQVVLIAVGRLAAEKNIIGLLRSFAAAHQAAPDARLLLVGEGPDRPQIEREIDRLNIAEVVHLTGEQPFGRIPAFLQAADIMVTASTTEVDPLTVIEGMMAGLPVVAQAADWTLDCLPLAGSWIAASEAEMIAALQEAIWDEDVRIKKGGVAQAFARQKTISQTCQKTVSLYQACLS